MARVPLVPDELFNSIKMSNPSILTNTSEKAMYGILSVVNTITPMSYSGGSDDSTNKKGIFNIFGKK